MQFSDDPKNPAGANCYACHQLTPQELSYGTIGPSLYQFGKTARLHRRDAQVRVGQGLQRRRVRRVLEHAALRPQPHPDRAADQRRRRAAGRSGVAGQQVMPVTAAAALTPACPARRAPSATPVRRREFLQALAAAAAAGLPIDAARAADDADGDASTTRLRRSATWRCCTSPTAMRSCCRCAFASRASTSASAMRAASRRIWSARRCCGISASRPARATRTRSPISISSARRARTARWAASRTSRRWCKRLRGGAPGRAAARRRRHVAGLGDVAVDARPGHGRRGEAARRRRDDRALGIHLRRGARQGSRRQRLRGPHRFRRAERAHGRLRRSGVRAVRDPRDQRRAGRRSSARRFRTRRSPTRATSCRNGRSASRRRDCRRASTRRAAKGAQVVVLLSHNGMDVDLKLASRVTGIDAILGGHTHDGVPQPTLVANRARQDARHQRRQQRQVPRRARLRRAPGGNRRLSLPAAAGVREPAAARSRRWTR